MKREANDSILPPGKGYEIRRTHQGLHKHHIFDGPLRPLSEKYGLYAYLDPEAHNLSNEGAHFNPVFAAQLREIAQRAFEKVFPELSFPAIFGRNFLPEKEFSHDELFGVICKDAPKKKVTVPAKAEIANHDELFGLDYLLKARNKRRVART